jgi:hypothetical protein
VPSGYVTSVVIITYTQVIGQATTIRTTITSDITTTIPVAKVTTQTFTELVPAPTTSAKITTIYRTLTTRRGTTTTTDPNVVYVTQTVIVGGDDGGDDGGNDGSDDGGDDGGDTGGDDGSDDGGDNGGQK